MIQTKSHGQDSKTRLLACKQLVTVLLHNMTWIPVLVYIFCLGWIWQLQQKSIPSSKVPLSSSLPTQMLPLIEVGSRNYRKYSPSQSESPGRGPVTAWYSSPGLGPLPHMQCSLSIIKLLPSSDKDSFHMIPA